MLRRDPQSGVRTLWICQRSGQNRSTHGSSRLSRNKHAATARSRHFLQKRNPERYVKGSECKGGGRNAVVYHAVEGVSEVPLQQWPFERFFFPTGRHGRGYGHRSARQQRRPLRDFVRPISTPTHEASDGNL